MAVPVLQQRRTARRNSVVGGVAGGQNPAGMLGVEEPYVHLMPGAAWLERAYAAASDDVADAIAEAVAR